MTTNAQSMSETRDFAVYRKSNLTDPASSMPARNAHVIVKKVGQSARRRALACAIDPGHHDKP